MCVLQILIIVVVEWWCQTLFGFDVHRIYGKTKYFFPIFLSLLHWMTRNVSGKKRRIEWKNSATKKKHDYFWSIKFIHFIHDDQCHTLLFESLYARVKLIRKHDMKYLLNIPVVETFSMERISLLILASKKKIIYSRLIHDLDDVSKEKKRSNYHHHHHHRLIMIDDWNFSFFFLFWIFNFQYSIASWFESNIAALAVNQLYIYNFRLNNNVVSGYTNFIVYFVICLVTFFVFFVLLLLMECMFM